MERQAGPTVRTKWAQSNIGSAIGVDWKRQARVGGGVDYKRGGGPGRV